MVQIASGSFEAGKGYGKLGALAMQPDGIKDSAPQEKVALVPDCMNSTTTVGRNLLSGTRRRLRLAGKK